MVEKVNLAVFGSDLKVTMGKYPLSKNGKQIEVVCGGEAHFMPSISATSFLDLPYRSFPRFWKVSYKRLYFAHKLSKSCVDFKTENVEGPAPELMKQAIAATMLKDIGKENEGLSWHNWVTLGIVILILLFQLGVF